MKCREVILITFINSMFMRRTSQHALGNGYGQQYPVAGSQIPLGPGISNRMYPPRNSWHIEDNPPSHLGREETSSSVFNFTYDDMLQFRPRNGKHDCDEKSLYCDSFLGYPYRKLKQVLAENKIPKTFLITDEAPLIASRMGPGRYDEITPCISSVRTIFPTMGRNKYNQPKIIFNDPFREPGYAQSVRIEICRSAGTDCNYFGDQQFLGYVATCRQKYLYRRLVSLNDDGRPGMDLLLFPSACVCVIRRGF